MSAVAIIRPSLKQKRIPGGGCNRSWPSNNPLFRLTPLNCIIQRVGEHRSMYNLPRRVRDAACSRNPSAFSSQVTIKGFGAWSNCSVRRMGGPALTGHLLARQRVRAYGPIHLVKRTNAGQGGAKIHYGQSVRPDARGVSDSRGLKTP
ncbi:hypothetical protein EVAR_4500_1 [Eumeta japonica]|uniref:Uncharacterized protein n=1 Tax=Eumeta variegata TaxID=151549 RepID=A0A4C1SYW8_EUMVA|nr:hypothetical protein EVAR_4500_1 [Eumeta japonica]